MLPCSTEEIGAFGAVRLDEDGRVVEFREKPKDAAARAGIELAPTERERLGVPPDRPYLASRGIYLFDKEVLHETLSHDLVDFGEDGVYTTGQIDELCRNAHDRGLPVHLDGARIFNAATVLGVEVRDLTASVDSIMFCLSKGLGAPVGSMLVGSPAFIAEARSVRKLQEAPHVSGRDLPGRSGLRRQSGCLLFQPRRRRQLHGAIRAECQCEIGADQDNQLWLQQAWPVRTSRGQMMRSIYVTVSLIAIVCAASVLPAGAQPKAPRPNIVYIVADDLGWKDVGFHGSDIRTPNIDKLAEGGASLESFYAQPLCTPSRAALMTGRYPLRYGLQTGVILAGQTYGLPTDEWLLPQALKEAGYTTAIVGKWHLGHADRKYWPQSRGFEHFYGNLIGEVDYFTKERG